MSVEEQWTSLWAWRLRYHPDFHGRASVPHSGLQARGLNRLFLDHHRPTIPVPGVDYQFGRPIGFSYNDLHIGNTDFWSDWNYPGSKLPESEERGCDHLRGDNRYAGYTVHNCIQKRYVITNENLSNGLFTDSDSDSEGFPGGYSFALYKFHLAWILMVILHCLTRIQTRTRFGNISPLTTIVCRMFALHRSRLGSQSPMAVLGIRVRVEIRVRQYESAMTRIPIPNGYCSYF